MAVVVADTSPLIALHRVGHLSLLARLFVEIHVPRAVAREVARGLPELPPWVVVRDLKQVMGSEILRASLGPGESEALSLVIELKANALRERPPFLPRASRGRGPTASPAKTNVLII